MCFIVVALEVKIFNRCGSISPRSAVHQRHTHTVTGTKERDWSTAAVVPLLLCTDAALLYTYTVIVYALMLWLRGSRAAASSEKKIRSS